MPSPSRLLLWVAATLAVVTLYKLLVTARAASGLLTSRINDPPEPERVLVIAATFAAIAVYSTRCLGTIATGQPLMPEPDPWIVWVLGGGHLSYLIGKAQRSRSSEDT